MSVYITTNSSYTNTVFWILLTKAIFSKIQTEFSSAQFICKECLFIYSSGNLAPGHYQNSPFHLKERITFKADIYLATSVWIFLQFPFTCFLKPSSQFPLLTQSNSIIECHHWESSTSNSVFCTVR